MTIETTKTEQFERASTRVDAAHQGDAGRRPMMLAQRWAAAVEFRRWQVMFARLGLPPAAAATVFSIGVEIGYELRVAQEEDEAAN